jgi:hypothetical protein
MTIRRRFLAIAAITSVAAWGALLAVPRDIAAETVPVRLSDQEFWKTVVNFSEPGRAFRSSGAVRSDNLISNETSFQQIIPDLWSAVGRGAYLGVGPEQNFTYIGALKPKIAFIIDIRRENMLLHLMYKALVEMSTDRVDFLSRLFARPRPAGVGHESTARALFEAFRPVSTSAELAEATLRTVFDRLERVHRFTLSREDEISIKDAYDAFCRGGPDIRWDSSGDSWIPSYADLMAQTDGQRRPHAYLASEEKFRVLKEYETNNRIVPLVGDFSGDKTLRAVGRYLKNHRETVTAFYTSNVEGYLFASDRWLKFVTNVSMLPIDSHSTFIRTHFRATRFTGGRPEYETSTVVDPIRELVQAFARGDLQSYNDILWRPQPRTR